MSLPIHPTYAHQSEYAEPLLRSASPASSVGTVYAPDETSFSDTEEQISDAAFDKKWLDKIGFSQQRWEEQKADQDPLLTVSVAGGKPVRLSDRKLEPQEEQIIFDRILHSLRNEINQLREDEIFDQMLLRGSKAMLEPRPTTNDIDALMRRMMSPSMSISGPHMGKDVGTTSPGPGQAPAITNGPWNHYGQTAAQEPKESYSVANTADSFLSGTTAGKRSRNGTRRKL